MWNKHNIIILGFVQLANSVEEFLHRLDALTLINSGGNAHQIKHILSDDETRKMRQLHGKCKTLLQLHAQHEKICL